MRTELALRSLTLALFVVATAAATRAQNCGGPVLAPQLSAGDLYGTAVAWAGDVALVGAPSSDVAGNDTGVVHVLAHLGAGYFAHQAQLLPTAPVVGEGFGASVALDGTWLVGGSPNSGDRAHVFQLIGGAWTATETLVASDGGQPSGFGASVSLSGRWLAVGAPAAAAGGFPSAGAVYVFERLGGNWIERQKLTDPAPQEGSGFGTSCALDGARLIVGAPGHAHAGVDSGRAFAFAAAAGAWSLAAILDPSDAAAGQLFGVDVALAGELAAIGAPGDDQDGLDAGAVYTFADAGGWTEDTKLGSQFAAPGDAFGSGLDLEAGFGGGHTLAAGSRGADLFPGGGDEGLVTAYQRFGANPWVYFGAGAPPDGVAGDGFGASVALENSAALAGTPLHDSVGPLGGSASGFTFIGDCFANGAFCTGDGSGTPCPCANGGLPGDGCENSGAHGATLISWGFPSLSNDTLAFGAWNLLAGQPALLFVGEQDLAGGAGIAFGDGLRCAGTNVVRLGIETPDAFGYAEWGPGLALASGAPPFSTRFFQAWYRDPNAGPCGSGFNLSNAWVRIVTP